MPGRIPRVVLSRRYARNRGGRPGRHESAGAENKGWAIASATVAITTPDGTSGQLPHGCSQGLALTRKGQGFDGH